MEQEGFIGVIKVGNKFQARLQVPGDGRGGSKKRKQHSLPGLFDTAEDAAVMRMLVTRPPSLQLNGPADRTFLSGDFRDC